MFQWRAETDEHEPLTGSNTLEEIKFDRGWDQARLDEELLKRRTILAYLIDNDLTEYTQVAATIQAFINDPDTILALVANDTLQGSLADLREMESVLIDIDPEKEEMVPRPDPTMEVADLSKTILAKAESRLFDQYQDMYVPKEGLAVALADTAKPSESSSKRDESTVDMDWDSDDESESADNTGADDESAHSTDPFGGFEEATVTNEEPKDFEEPRRLRRVERTGG